jgi:hypothetical protein
MPCLALMSKALKSIRSMFAVLHGLASDLVRFLWSCVSSRTALVAENLFLRKQLAFYQEHQVRPRRLTNAARISLVFWSRFFDWKSALLSVKPATLIGWHRKAFRLFWKWKSRPGRPGLPAVRNLGIVAIKTPIRTPQANAFCERLIGTVRRECLDFMIPLNERHLRQILREWVSHYNRGRPHSSLGPGIPDQRTAPPCRIHRHRFEPRERVVSTAILGGLHHEYEVLQAVA